MIDEDELEFAVFCIESIAERLALNGAEVYKLLTRDSKLLDEYVIAYYEALHTQGKEYIVEDITGFMREEGLIC
ncbi:MAG: DUF3791 domain-containing protein [Synergistaceae bacterium]|jgi:hypothetical protein|nr:DUF3791 domain-containing protein [Synergistaceae bacterium]